MLEADQRDVTELSSSGAEPGQPLWYAERQLADESGGVDKNKAAAVLLAKRVGAASSLWLVQHFELKLGSVFAEELADRLVDVLAALPPRVRLETCERLRLPISMRPFARTAGPVLRLLIEDEVLRPFFADGAARLWIELDMRDVALPAALGIVDEVSSMTLMSLAQMVEPEEAFEFLFARFEREPFFAELISRSPLLRGQDRWVAPALTRLHDDARNAARMLRTIGTPRAHEEHAGAIAAATACDDAFIALCDESAGLPAENAVEAVVGVLEQPWASADKLGRLWSFGRHCREHAEAIRARVRDNVVVHGLFAEILAMNPPPAARTGRMVLG